MRKKGGPEFECLWFSPGTPASSTTKTVRHDIAEILLKVALSTKKINQSINQSYITKFFGNRDRIQFYELEEPGSNSEKW